MGIQVAVGPKSETISITELPKLYEEALARIVLLEEKLELLYERLYDCGIFNLNDVWSWD